MTIFSRCHRCRLGVHLLIAENGEKSPFVIVSHHELVLLDNHSWNVKQKNIGGHVGLLAACHNPLLAVERYDVFPSEVSHVDVGKPGEDREYEDVTHLFEAFD